MSWQSEKKAHPWATVTQAKRIAKDHRAADRAKKVVHKNVNRTIHPSGKGCGPINTARKDFGGLLHKSKEIANRKAI